MRLEVELIDPQQDGAADDQRETHHPGIEKIALDEAAGGRPDYRGRQERHQHADDEAPRVGITEHAERDPPQFGEIDHDDRKNRAELNQHRKALPETALAKPEETLRQQQMARRGNRQKFRDALDDAENYRPQCIRQHDVVHFDWKIRALLAYSHLCCNRKKTAKHRLPRALAWL